MLENVADTVQFTLPAKISKIHLFQSIRLQNGSNYTPPLTRSWGKESFKDTFPLFYVFVIPCFFR